MSRIAAFAALHAAGAGGLGIGSTLLSPAIALTVLAERAAVFRAAFAALAR